MTRSRMSCPVSTRVSARLTGIDILHDAIGEWQLPVAQVIRKLHGLAIGLDDLNVILRRENINRGQTHATREQHGSRVVLVLDQRDHVTAPGLQDGRR